MAEILEKTDPNDCDIAVYTALSKQNWEGLEVNYFCNTNRSPWCSLLKKTTKVFPFFESEQWVMRVKRGEIWVKRRAISSGAARSSFESGSRGNKQFIERWTKPLAILPRLHALPSMCIPVPSAVQVNTVSSIQMCSYLPQKEETWSNFHSRPGSFCYLQL